MPPATQLEFVGRTSSRYVREVVRRLESEAGQSMGETTVDSLRSHGLRFCGKSREYQLVMSSMRLQESFGTVNQDVGH